MRKNISLITFKKRNQEKSRREVSELKEIKRNIKKKILYFFFINYVDLKYLNLKLENNNNNG